MGLKISTELTAEEEDALRFSLRHMMKHNMSLSKMLQATPHEKGMYEDKAQLCANLMVKLGV